MLRGAFWVVDGKLLAFPFREGAQIGVAKSSNTYNYRLLWEHIKLQGCKKPFKSYPRDRIGIKRLNVPNLFMNSKDQGSMLSEIGVALELHVLSDIYYEHNGH